MEISVVISAYNPDVVVLRRTIEALLAQEFPPDQYEVIVADDGSTNGLGEMIATFTSGVPVVHASQPHRGLSAARNLGARTGRGRIVLFVDADFWATPALLARHHAHYLQGAHGIAVQGVTLIHPDSLVTPFMKVKEVSPDLTRRRRHNLSPYHVVGRNFSMLRADLQDAGGFDEGFTQYGWEDLDLALRMQARGLAIEYEPEAVGYHYHVEALEGVREKFRQAGGGAVYIWTKHGRSFQLGLFLEILPWMLPFKWLVFRTPLVMPLLHWLIPRAEARGWLLVLNECYKNLLQEAFYEGVFRALGSPRSRGTLPHAQPASAEKT
jgi:glycosyltransferase involved in cell wall biosynthesis